MGAFLAVILANSWMKSIAEKLNEEVCSPETDLKIDPSEKCPDCSRKIIWNIKGRELERCRNWFHAKCQKIGNADLKK